jgi:ABC-type multidrug transport system ATPase subunit
VDNWINGYHTMGSLNYILECDGISLDFDFRKILGGIYLKCQTGEAVGLLGRNGSGKSCLLKIIFGSLPVEEKSIRINGIPLTRSFQKNTLAYLPQHHFIPSSLTMKEAFRIYNVNTDIVLNYFPDFDKHLNQKPSQISGGVLRIFEVMLVSDLPVKFLLLDEPFSGVMPIHIEHLCNYLAELKTNKGIIITDHFHKHITSMADRLYVLANGKTYGIQNKEQLIQYGYLNAL